MTSQQTSERITAPWTVIDNELNQIERDWEGTTLPGVSYIVGRVLGAMASWSLKRAKQGDPYWRGYNHALIDAIYGNIRAIEMMEHAEENQSKEERDGCL